MFFDTKISKFASRSFDKSYYYFFFINALSFLIACVSCNIIYANRGFKNIFKPNKILSLLAEMTRHIPTSVFFIYLLPIVYVLKITFNYTIFELIRTNNNFSYFAKSELQDGNSLLLKKVNACIKAVEFINYICRLLEKIFLPIFFLYTTINLLVNNNNKVKPISFLFVAVFNCANIVFFNLFFQKCIFLNFEFQKLLLIIMDCKIQKDIDFKPLELFIQFDSISLCEIFYLFQFLFKIYFSNSDEEIWKDANCVESINKNVNLIEDFIKNIANNSSFSSCHFNLLIEHYCSLYKKIAVYYKLKRALISLVPQDNNNSCCYTINTKTDLHSIAFQIFLFLDAIQSYEKQSKHTDAVTYNDGLCFYAFNDNDNFFCIQSTTPISLKRVAHTQLEKGVIDIIQEAQQKIGKSFYDDYVLQILEEYEKTVGDVDCGKVKSFFNNLEFCKIYYLKSLLLCIKEEMIEKVDRVDVYSKFFLSLNFEDEDCEDRNTNGCCHCKKEYYINAFLTFYCIANAKNFSDQELSKESYHPNILRINAKKINLLHTYHFLKRDHHFVFYFGSDEIIDANVQKSISEMLLERHSKPLNADDKSSESEENPENPEHPYEKFIHTMVEVSLESLEYQDIEFLCQYTRELVLKLMDYKDQGLSPKLSLTDLQLESIRSSVTLKPSKLDTAIENIKSEFANTQKS